MEVDSSTVDTVKFDGSQTTTLKWAVKAEKEIERGKDITGSWWRQKNWIAEAQHTKIIITVLCARIVATSEARVSEKTIGVGNWHNGVTRNVLLRSRLISLDGRKWFFREVWKYDLLPAVKFGSQGGRNAGDRVPKDDKYGQTGCQRTIKENHDSKRETLGRGDGNQWEDVKMGGCCERL